MGQIRINHESAPFRAHHAILLYGDGSSKSFASVHDVTEDEHGDLCVEAGVPASVKGLRTLFATLEPGKFERPSLQGVEILSSGAEWLVWWFRPQARRVWFDARQIGQKCAIVPQPGLVFSVSPLGWQVFALATPSRPRSRTKLYQAPYYNVWSGGKICEGSAHVPKGDERKDPEAWEKAFFESRFTHPNVHEKDRLVKYRGGPVRFWQHMLSGKFEAFPKEVLVPTKLTLGDHLDAIGRAL